MSELKEYHARILLKTYHYVIGAVCVENEDEALKKFKDGDYEVVDYLSEEYEQENTRVDEVEELEEMK